MMLICGGGKSEEEGFGGKRRGVGYARGTAKNRQGKQKGHPLAYCVYINRWVLGWNRSVFFLRVQKKKSGEWWCN